MKRREILLQTGLSVAALWSWPSWAHGWSKTKIIAKPYLSAGTDSLLAEIVETIIPETGSPGAKSLGVHQLIQKIIKDCNGKEAFEVFEKRLTAFKKTASLKKDFMEMKKSERTDFIKGLNEGTDSEMKALYGQLKSMTIQGYTQSEYFLTNVAGYEWAPNRYLGCVKLK